MDELEEAIERAERELASVKEDLSALRAERDRPLAALAQQLAQVQAETARAERRNAELSEKLQPRRDDVARLRARLDALRRKGQGTT